MEIKCIGYNHPHDSKFVINRPNGVDSWLFLLIKTPAVFMKDGQKIVTKKNSFILYSKDTPQYYQTYGEIYIDDWFHFVADEKDVQFFQELNIPFNTVTELSIISDLSAFIRTMTYEFYSNELYKPELMDLYLRTLFYKLSQRVNSCCIPESGSASRHYDCMQHIRNEIFNMPQKSWSINEIAREHSMSRSGFQHIYKNTFGVSATTDIINSRLQRVKFLLQTTDMTLDKIAEQCGYSSENYLMRQFKEKFGVTPGQFRKNI
ncbi:AraC family transcriptional regulator [Anaeromicropila populeti]|uniref:AraC family transcriptional regulator, arabinose operon regulatory protein n=1 Tax=Anaeromicropila populeti TaxID=37658 RepID=A0A1I6JLY2_9FIRM|nr:AraC family transcriptional regulator [Anaeromicropila populeti]SFR79988.1 AraC family transcriptional regulator, arabinose operon regulatory protein [Anaeromicropila populeti]